jgi:hypothetical protein
MIGATAVVIGALLAGVVAGRATALNSDHRILEYLPVVRNIDLLREAIEMGNEQGRFNVADTDATARAISSRSPVTRAR